MAFNWKDYYILAKDLRGGTVCPCEEATLRTAISRSYYSAYHIVSNIAFEKLKYEVDKSSGRPHQDLIDRLKKEDNPNWIAMGCDLASLKGFRVWADYKNEYKDVPKAVITAFAWYDQIIARVNSLRAASQ